MNTQQDHVKQYLINIGRYPRLSYEQEIEPAYRIQAHDSRAKQQSELIVGIRNRARIIVEKAMQHPQKQG